MKNKVGVSALASMLANVTGKNKKVCEDFIKEFFRMIGDSLAEGENVRVKGFGTFKLVRVDSRKSVDVSSGEEIEIPAHNKVVFIPVKRMAAVINEPFEAFESVELADDIQGIEIEESIPEVDDDEDTLSDERLEYGSVGEDIDDEVTAEAYTEKEKEEEKVENPVEIINEPIIVSSEIGEEKREPIISSSEISEEKAEPIVASSEISEEKGEPIMATNETSEEKPEPIIAAKEERDYQSQKKFGWGFFYGVFTAVILCLLLFITGYCLGWWQMKESQPEQMAEMEQPTAIEDFLPEKVLPVEEDNEIWQSEEIESEEPNDKEVSKEKEDRKDKEKEISVPTKASDEPVYDYVSPTRYLTTISRAHYGNYNLWPYIYIENQAVLGHPDRIRPGTQVVVPPLSKYGVDPNNKDDIKKAKKMGLEIYARYK